MRSTGVSTEPVRVAAEKFLAALTEEQRRKTLFPVDDLEWRKWMNVSFYVRQGVGFNDMSEAQREAAFGLMRASLSAKGMKLSRDTMKLNHTLGELNNDNFTEYGEWLYWITVMGTPSATEPWGWQLDGHHLIVNYFVLGDQVVMTPSFFGSEPVRATAGKYRGTVIMQEEQDAGLAFMKSLTPEQRTAATLRTSKTGNENLTEAFKDNVVLDYAGVPARTLNDSQKRQLLTLIGLYVHNMRDEHARVRIDEVNAHMDQDPLRVDRRHRARLRVLLPHPQPGDPDRVRSPEAGEPAAPVPGRAEPRSHSRGRAHAERQRLRQGSTAAALRYAPALARPDFCRRASRDKAGYPQPAAAPALRRCRPTASARCSTSP